MKQTEAVVQAMEKLGGVATLGQLYQEVFKIKECVWVTKTPQASVRRIIQENNQIYKIKPGLYGLKSHQKELEALGILVETAHNQDSKAVEQFNHTYYQGLLLTVGKLKNMNTFAPNQDKNKLFLKQKLSEIRTLQKIPPFSYDNLVKRSSTIDAIWFNEREMPQSFFEVEHSTNIQDSLLKFNDLQDFYVRMFIVAAKRRFREFELKISYSSFSELKKNKRVNFLSYEELEKQYRQLAERQFFDTLL